MVALINKIIYNSTKY